MSVIPGISHWNMGNIRLGEEEAVEKGQKFFGGEQHSHRPHTSLCFLRGGRCDSGMYLPENFFSYCQAHRSGGQDSGGSEVLRWGILYKV